MSWYSDCLGFENKEETVPMIPAIENCWKGSTVKQVVNKCGTDPVTNSGRVETIFYQSRQLLDMTFNLRLKDHDFGRFNVQEDKSSRSCERILSCRHQTNLLMNVTESIEKLRRSVFAIVIADRKLNPSLQIISVSRSGTT